MNSLLSVFFLFEYEHDVVEKLLQFFIGKVDTQLFKTVVLQFEIVNIKIEILQNEIYGNEL